MDIEHVYSTLDEIRAALKRAQEEQENIEKKVLSLRRYIDANREPILVESSHGTFKISPRTGEVLTFERSGEQVHDDSNESFRMDQIRQFNLGEYARWWGEQLKPGDSIDILLLGYWYEDNGVTRYEVPVRDFRKEVETLHKAPTEEQLPSTMKVSTKEYTVILLYPDYMAENYGQETYTTTVEAMTPSGAVHLARVEANTFCDGEIEREEDLFCIACMEGHHPPLAVL